MASALLNKHDGNNKNDVKGGESKKKSKDGKFKNKYQHWKCISPNDGESNTKVVEVKTYYYCDKPQVAKQKQMWALHEPVDRKDRKTKSSPKKEDVKLDFKDDLKSLLSVLKKDF